MSVTQIRGLFFPGQEGNLILFQKKSKIFCHYEFLRTFEYENIRSMIMKKPTESEMEILQVLWEKGPSTVRAVHEALNKKKETGYTTTLKLMQIMLEKQLISRDDSSRTHIYTPSISQVAGRRQAVDKIIDSMFKGSSAKLVMHALGNHQSSPEELDQIRAYLNQLKDSESNPS